MRSPGRPWPAAIAGGWAGLLLCLAAMAAPSAFAVLPRTEAGLLLARLFAEEAAISLALALLLIFMERRWRRLVAEGGTGDPQLPPAHHDTSVETPAFTLELGLLLGTMFCTVAGYYAVQPMMEAARSGHGSWSFGALHTVSGAFFALKGLLVLALVWRYAGSARVKAAATPS